MARWIALAVVVAAGLLAYLALPRGELSGTPASFPGSWSFLSEDEPCMLETRATQPRAVRVGCYSVDGTLHVHSHRWADLPRLFGSNWVEDARQNPSVRVLIRAQLYEALAIEVTDESARESILRARGFDPPPEGMKLFRFAAPPTDGGPK